MQLSKRLQAVADSVTRDNRVADVGCDHAYISIYLIQQHIAPHVIAMDINKGPLERGRKNIERLGLSSHIETRLSDGLHELNPGEADTILIAGMGGALTVRILEEGLTTVKKCKELVLGPQSELFLVRKFLDRIEFEIIAEQMLIDDGKYYTILKAIPKITDSHENEKITLLSKDVLSGDNSKQELFYRYGKLLLRQRDPVTEEFLLKEKNQRLRVMEEIKQNLTENAMIRLKEIQEELGYIEEGLSYYN